MAEMGFERMVCQWIACGAAEKADTWRAVSLFGKKRGREGGANFTADCRRCSG